MKRLALFLVSTALLVSALAPSAQAAFEVEDFSLGFEDAAGLPLTQAGSHPFAVNNTIKFHTVPDPFYGEVPEGAIRNLDVDLPDGLVGDPAATPRCSNADFINIDPETKIPHCSNSSAVGVILVKTLDNTNEISFISAPVYNLISPPGAVQKLGFNILGVPVAIEFTLSQKPPYNVVAKLRNIAQPLPIYSSKLIVWGNPANPAHDTQRGACINGFGSLVEEIRTEEGCSIPANIAEKPFVTLPRSCEPLSTSYLASAWQAFPAVSGVVPVAAMTECADLGFGPTISAKPTTKAARSPTGLDFNLDVDNEGLTSSIGRSQSDIRKAVVTLPEGFTTNPSVAEGLGGCSEAALARETADSAPGAGCPNDSKIGTVEVETPLLEENLNGSIFVATPYENQVGSLIALYMVIKNPKLGISITQALKIETDPVTGRITSVADNLPQLPFSHFKLSFRQGDRSPLASPYGCGTFEASAVLTPWSGGAPITTTSTFQITSGPSGGACPSGTPPFQPGFEAGTMNNAAGSYSPFYARLTRSDSEQEISNLSFKLPPGLAGKLAGIPFCPDAAIAAAKARTGPRGGQEELSNPSCQQASAVGRTLVGAGVGPALTYVPGKLYLAGSYNGSPLSVVAITPVRVGPFDLGTVVVREALRIDPRTAEVFVDAAGSDPIPHIIQGIQVQVRDIRIYADRPSFTLNPTSCDRFSVVATALGSGSSFTSTADDQSADASSPFQAADCASLAFAPRMSLRLKGGTKRGKYPALRVAFEPRAGNANSSRIAVALPHSEFLAQEHIRTVCTRVQFNAGVGHGSQCPAGSIYGRARAFTPLLSDPLEGPVYLRSSSNPLPDLVLSLHGLIDFEAIGRIDSVNGGIRNTFDFVPDVPVDKVVVNFPAGKKSLLVNSTDICKNSHRATVGFIGQNGKVHKIRPVLKAQCKKSKKKNNTRPG